MCVECTYTGDAGKDRKEIEGSSDLRTRDGADLAFIQSGNRDDGAEKSRLQFRILRRVFFLAPALTTC